MTIIANTTLVFDIKGVREELANTITNISPEDTPFSANAGKDGVENTLYEWQRDSYAAAVSTNAVIQGDDFGTASFDAVVPTVRLGNRTQISRKAVIVAGTTNAVNTAGRKTELAYQVIKRGVELKRDIEKNALDNIGAVTGNSTTAPKTGTMGATIGSIDGTNVSMGATGTNPTDPLLFTDPRNDGTQRAATEALLKVVLQGVYTNGGNPDTIMVGPFNKSVFSGFAGIATKTINQEAARPAMIIGSADTYVGEFGTFSIVPNRFQRDRDAWVLDFEMIDFVYLRPYRVEDLAKTGDAEKKMLLTEWGLKVKTDHAHGLLADLLTS